MITKRTTAETLIASIYDTAVMKIDPSRVRKYAITRNLKHAGIHEDGKIDGVAELATLFRVRPLNQKLVHLIDMVDGNSVYQRMIAKNCIVDIKNAGDISVTFDDEDRSLSDETIDAIGMDIVKDIALFCSDQVRGKNGNTSPFSLPDGWQTEATRQRSFDAVYATTATKNAREKDMIHTE